MADGQRPLELILARNLLSSLSTPGFLVDEDGILVFYNESAAALLGVSFEDAGRMGPEEWGTAFGPFDETGEQVPFEQLPLTIALRQGLPAHSHFTIRSLGGEEHPIEASALPIRASAGTSGAMVFFWRLEAERSEAGHERPEAEQGSRDAGPEAPRSNR